MKVCLWTEAKRYLFLKNKQTKTDCSVQAVEITKWISYEDFKNSSKQEIEGLPK